VPAAGVSDLVDVHDASHGRIPVSEQEGDLVDALASEQGARGDCMAESVHRRHGAGGYGNTLMEDGEGRLPVLVRRALLCFAQRAGDVPLGQRPA
jgi:hypothetical protein